MKPTCHMVQAKTRASGCLIGTKEHFPERGNPKIWRPQFINAGDEMKVDCGTIKFFFRNDL